MKVYLVGRRGVVLNVQDARELYFNGFFGTPLKNPKPKKEEDITVPFVLSLFEVLYLMKKGRIEVFKGKRKVEVEEVINLMNDRERVAYKVYEDLRERGFVVRSGLKFGCDFAVYEKGPGIDHAPFVVHVVEKDVPFEPVDIVRAGRVAHGTRKRFVMAIVESGKINYIMFKWTGT